MSPKREMKYKILGSEWLDLLSKMVVFKEDHKPNQVEELKLYNCSGLKLIINFTNITQINSWNSSKSSSKLKPYARGNAPSCYFKVVHKLI